MYLGDGGIVGGGGHPRFKLADQKQWSVKFVCGVRWMVGGRVVECDFRSNLLVSV